MDDTVDATVARQQLEAEATWVAEFLRGPERTRWSELPVQVGDMAPDTGVTGYEWPTSSPLHMVE